MSPEQLWILNPKRILKNESEHRSQPESESLFHPAVGKEPVVTANICQQEEKVPECWICYDSERTDAGVLIQPCLCKGEMGAVHHDCLRRWLVESADNPNTLTCKVCNHKYELQRGNPWLPAGFTVAHWLYSLAIITFMCCSGAAAWTVIQLYEEPAIRMVSIGGVMIIQYVCLRFLGFSAVTAYQRAKYSAVKIMGRRFSSGPNRDCLMTVTSSNKSPEHGPAHDPV